MGLATTESKTRPFRIVSGQHKPLLRAVPHFTLGRPFTPALLFLPCTASATASFSLPLVLHTSTLNYEPSASGCVFPVRAFISSIWPWLDSLLYYGILSIQWLGCWRIGLNSARLCIPEPVLQFCSEKFCMLHSHQPVVPRIWGDALELSYLEPGFSAAVFPPSWFNL